LSDATESALGGNGETQDYLLVRDVHLSAWPTHQGLGDLHLVPEGLFFLARVKGLVGILSDPTTVSQLGVGGLLLAPLLRRSRTVDAETWRNAQGGRPLDELVAQNPGSLWVRPGDIASLVRTLDGFILRRREARRVIVRTGLGTWPTIAAFAQRHGWPIREPTYIRAVFSPLARAAASSAIVWIAVWALVQGVAFFAACLRFPNAWVIGGVALGLAAVGLAFIYAAHRLAGPRVVGVNMLVAGLSVLVWGVIKVATLQPAPGHPPLPGFGPPREMICAWGLVALGLVVMLAGAMLWRRRPPRREPSPSR
jgi:hypothetical protein